MAARTYRPGRRLIYFVVGVALLYALVALTADWKPKLGLDLQGGTRITLQAHAESGKNPTATAMGEARSIIDQRVNGTGVAEASVVVQGSNIVVEIPGQNKQDLADEIRKSAQLYFRLVADIPTQYQAAADPNATVDPGTLTQGADVADYLAWMDDPGTSWLTKYQSYACPTTTADVVDDPKQPLIACDASGQKYLLSAAAIAGKDLSDAGWGTPQNGVGYVVTLDFKSKAAGTFATVTGAINQAYDANDGLQKRFAIVLDGQVLSTPTVSNGAIIGGNAQITGNFTQEEASGLANNLKYGALPLKFDVGENSNEGPTLAGQQLSAGLWAGGIGLALVVVYCLLYYRGLGVVVLASLVAAATATYAIVLLMSKAAGFTLTLPGIAGLIVAVGITADSFIVYFERIRDEMREGKSLRVAVEAGWKRARNTCLAADGVSLLAAVVLYFFTIGVVKGFAFALGISTVIDLAVFFWFTKPLVSWVSRRRFFQSGSKLSGLSADHIGIEPTTVVKAGARR